MQYEISNRMSDVHGSAIRELFKLGADPNMISFGGGNPSAETFPVPEIADIIADVMKNAPVSVLQYGLSEGYTPLRDTMKDYLTRTQGFDFENNELFILSGGQQCADLTTKVLVNEGDVILTEDPAFVGCLNLLNAPLRLVRITSSNWSSFMRTIRPSRVMPALLTRMNGTPISSLISLSAVLQAS